MPAIIAYQEYFETNEECVAIELIEDLVVENGFISFETESFSIFAVGEVFLNTFEFYVDDELVNRQYIIGDSNGKGTLVEPETPYKEHYLFNGWLIEDSDEYVDFGYISVNMSETIITKYYADFEEICYAYFLYEAKEGAYILETLTGKPGDTVSTEFVDYPLSLDRHVISWHTDVELTSPKVSEITFEFGKDIILYPNVIEGAWITFYTDGGSHMEPVFYPDGESIEAPTNPTKTGYEFGGWKDENDDFFEFNGQTLTNSVSLTAYWVSANTNYYVQIMFERQNSNGKYDAATGGLFIKQAPTGAVVNGNMATETERNNAINGIDDESAFIMDFAHYEYNATKSASSTATVLGDGSSIVYVYYDLKYYTVTFDLGTDTSKKLTIGGKTYTGGSSAEKYKITAKYGDLIADKWPLAEHFEANDNFRRWQYKKGYYWATKQHYMIGSDLIGKTMTANYSTSDSIIAWYLVESLDQTSPEGGSFSGKDFRKLYEGVYYDMDPVYTQEVKSTVSQWSTQKPIAGYNIVKMVKDSANACVYMYYSRTRHNLKLYNQNDLVFSIDNVMYGTPLNRINGLSYYINGGEPNYPSGYPENTYQFAGWYNTIQCYDGTDVDLQSLSIPNQDLILYAKWAPIDVKLYVHVTIDGTDDIIEGFNGFTVLYGDKVDKDRVDTLKASVNIPDEAIWYGWYEKINIGGGTTVLVPYNFNRELVEDLVLYPFYSYIEPTKVLYDLNGGSGETPVDEYSYAVGKGAIILNAEGVTPPENKVFLGWSTDPNGLDKIYYPNDIMVLSDRDIVLYAIYGDKADEDPEVDLIYYNTITLEQIVNTYKLYDTVEIADITIFAESVSKKYVFKEYNTEIDGSGDSFFPNETVNLTLEEENILYAIYDEVNVVLLEIPIVKYFNNFVNVSDVFTINAVFCNENGEEIESINDFITFKYKGSNSQNLILDILFDTDRLLDASEYYLKVYEESTIAPIISDSSYYILSINIEDLKPVIKSVNRYYENGNIDLTFEYTGALEFFNIYGIGIDDLPDMGGQGTNSYRIIGLIVGIIGICIVFICGKRKNK